MRDDGGGGDDDGATGDGPRCVAELCNGIDDNCDGAVDEGCPCTPFDVTLNLGTVGPTNAIAWTGSTYVIGYPVGSNAQVLATVDQAGTVAPISNVDSRYLTGQDHGQIVWTGSKL